MRLILSIAVPNKDDGHHSQWKDYEFQDCRAVLGSAENADLILKGLAPLSLLIDRDDRGQLAVFRKDPKLAFKIDGKPVTSERGDLRNGSTLQIGDKEILVRVEFDRVTQSSRAGILTAVVAVLVAIIFASELSIITWLPRRIERSKLWAQESLRQQTLSKLDNLRYRLRAILRAEKGPGVKKDTYTGPTAELYRAETDRLALYVREQHDRLSTDQLTQIKQDLDILDIQANRLQQRTLIPKAKQLDIDAALKATLAPGKKGDK